jgi:hypothetical protein
MLAKAADRRMNGTMILYIRRVDMIAGWKTGINR